MKRCPHPRRLLLLPLSLLSLHIIPVVAQSNETGPASVEAAGTCAAPEARQFDFWTGEWNVLNRQLRRSDGEWLVTGTATMAGHPVAGGCAFVEHWQGTTAGGRTLGFSLRSYDPATGTWTILLNWPRPERARFSTIVGGFHHGRGEFYFDFVSQDSTPTRGRFSFSDISPRSLRWDQAFSTDSGRSWLTTWIMEFSRRDPTAPPLINGPTPLGSDLMCTGDEARALDFLTGEWSGTDSLVRNGDSTVTLEAFPIVGGCASVARLIRGSYERFQVLSLVTSEDEGAADPWKAYAVDSNSPLFTASAGRREGREVVFTSIAGDTRRRERWTPEDGSGTLRLTVEASSDGGKESRVVSRMLFKRKI